MDNITILFVDDQKIVLNILEKMFKNEPYEKIFISDAYEALKILETKKVDIIISEIILPELTGLELLEIVKNKYPDTVRIVLSGFTHVDLIIEAINKVDVFKYLTKPFKLNEATRQIIDQAIVHRKELMINKRMNNNFNYSLRFYNEINNICLINNEHKEVFFEKNNERFVIEASLPKYIVDEDLFFVFHSDSLKLYYSKIDRIFSESIKNHFNGYTFYNIENNGEGIIDIRYSEESLILLKIFMNFYFKNKKQAYV